MTTSLLTASSPRSFESSADKESELETPDEDVSSADLTDTGRSFTVNSTSYTPAFAIRNNVADVKFWLKWFNGFGIKIRNAKLAF